MKRSSRGRTRRRRSIRKKGHPSRMELILVTLMFGIAFTVIFAFSFSYVVFGEYNGLGKSMSLATSGYSNSFLKEKKGVLSYEDANYTAVQGIDVSTYQGEINWKKVKEDGISFAMIRLGYRSASDGEIHLDKRFRRNIKDARNAGVEVGVYFFSQAVSVDEAVQEAKYVIRKLRNYTITYPVAFDMEKMEGDRISELTKEEKTQITDAFCSILQKNGYQPMVYGNMQWLLRNVDMTYLTDYPTWLAHYTNKMLYPYEYAMWQYSDSGSVDGISGDVDRDLYFKKNE